MGKNNVGVLERLINGYNIDVLILAESRNTRFERLCTVFKDYAYLSHKGCPDITMMCKSQYNPRIVTGTDRGFPIMVENTKLGKILIFGCHLESELAQDGRCRRRKQIREINLNFLDI